MEPKTQVRRLERSRLGVILRYRFDGARRRLRTPSLSRGARALPLFLLLALAACANANERLADSITRAVIANDLSPVMNRLDPRIEGVLTRVRVAQISDELSAQGAYDGLRQTKDSWCPQEALCFDVQFAKGTYHEVMRLAHNGKVRYWWIRAAATQS